MTQTRAAIGTHRATAITSCIRNLRAQPRSAVVDTLAKHHETERESSGMPLESLSDALGASMTITRIAIENLTESGEVRAQSGQLRIGRT